MLAPHARPLLDVLYRFLLGTNLWNYFIKPEIPLLQTMAVERIITISPSTNKPILERNGLSEVDLATLPATATEAFKSFRQTSLADRQAIVKKALEGLEKKKGELAHELTEQMGRPIAYTAKEITTAVARAEYLLKISDDALKDTDGEPEMGFKRYIRKYPVGPVLILFAWNVRMPSHCLYSQLTEVVSLSHSRQRSDTSSPRWQLRDP